MQQITDSQGKLLFLKGDVINYRGKKMVITDLSDTSMKMAPYWYLVCRKIMRVSLIVGTGIVFWSLFIYGLFHAFSHGPISHPIPKVVPTSDVFMINGPEYRYTSEDSEKWAGI